jgi:hypothetical protein
MPTENTQVLNKRVPLVAGQAWGQAVITEQSSTGPLGGQDNMQVQVSGWTGTNGLGSSLVPDVLYSTVTTTLIPDKDAPVGANGAGVATRLYPSRVDICVEGVTPWTGLTAIVIQDTAGVPLLWIPAMALVAGGSQGFASYTFPEPTTIVPTIWGATTSPTNEGAATITTNGTLSVAQTGTTTVTTTFTTSANSSHGTNSYQYYPGFIIDGVGKAQGFICSASTATTIATTTPFLTAPTSGSWLYMPYQQNGNVTSQTALTPVVAPLAGANALATNFSVLWGPGSANAGYARLITANNGSTTITQNSVSTAPVAYDFFMITNNPGNNGIVDLGIQQHWASMTPGKGLQAVIINGSGTAGIATQGAPVRVYIEASWAY